MYRTGRISRHVVFVLIPLILIALNVAHAEFAEDPPVYLRQWAVPSPSGAAFDSLGSIYVVDRSHKLVKKSDYYGVPVTEWASCGASNLSQCTVPYDIAFDSIGNIYVIDTSGIAKFDKDAKFLRRFGVQGSFGSGIAVHFAFDSFGNPFTNIYVTNPLSHSVQKFSSEGILLAQWGQYGMAVGQFRYPYDVEIDSEGNVYVADSYNWRIQKFDSNGKFLTQWPSVYASGLAIDDSDNIYVISWARCSIQKFTTEGILLTQWGSCGNEEGKFMSPFRINISPAGEIYVSDTGNNRIQVFGPVSIDEDGDGYTEDIDCDDTNPNIHPDAAEICNGTDDNCNGSSDEGVRNTYCRDIDGDGYGAPGNTTQACTAPLGYVTNCTDGCPNDPGKQAPGACGCGVPDTYSDDDADGIDNGCDPCDNRPITGIISTSKGVLWPPDHHMVPVTVVTSSLMGHNPTVQLRIPEINPVAIIEPNIEGDNIYRENNFEPDFEITGFEITGALSLNLRSERAGNSQARTYIITVTAEDCSGSYNFTTEVIVPHDKGK